MLQLRSQTGKGCFSSFMVQITAHTFWSCWSLSFTEEALKGYKQWDQSFRWTLTRWQPHVCRAGVYGWVAEPTVSMMSPCVRIATPAFLLFALNVLDSVYRAIGRGKTGPCCAEPGNMLWYTGQHVLYLVWKPYTLKISKKHPKEGSN